MGCGSPDKDHKGRGVFLVARGLASPRIGGQEGEAEA